MVICLIGGLNTENLGLRLYCRFLKYNFKKDVDLCWLVADQQKREGNDGYLDLFQIIVNVWFHSTILCYLLSEKWWQISEVPKSFFQNTYMSNKYLKYVIPDLAWSDMCSGKCGFLP